MGRKLVVVLGVLALTVCLAAPGFTRGMDDHGTKATVTKIEGNQVTVTVDSKDKMSLKEGDKVWLKSGKMDGDGMMKREGDKSAPSSPGKKY